MSTEYDALVTGYYRKKDGSGPYSYDPATDAFTLVTFGGSSGGASAANQLTQIARATAQSVKDSAGTVFDPESCSHVLAYSSGNLVTDTATDGAVVRVQTYTYTGGELTAISKWVVQ